MHGFKSAIFPELKNCQNGTFEPLHGRHLLKQYEDAFTKKHPPNPGFRSVRGEN
jgi:hypothetical protein